MGVPCVPKGFLKIPSALRFAHEEQVIFKRNIVINL